MPNTSDKISVSGKNLKYLNKSQKKIIFSKSDLNASSQEKSNLNVRKIIKQDSNLVNIIGNYNVKIIKLGESNCFEYYKLNTAKRNYFLHINNCNYNKITFKYLIEDRLCKLLNKNRIVSESILHVSLKKFPEYKLSIFDSGKTFHDLYNESKLQERDLVKLGEEIRKVHAIKVEKYGQFDLFALANNEYMGLQKQWKDFLLNNLDKHLSYNFRNKLITKHQEKTIEERLTIGINNLKKYKPVLLHGDLSNRNIIKQRNGKILLIDWDSAICGDYVYDLAFYGTGSYIDNKLIESLLKGYFGNKKISKEVLDRYWLYYLRIALFKNVIRHKMNYNSRVNGQNLNNRINYALDNI